METINLSLSDRARIYALTDELERFNNSLSEVLVSCREAARLLKRTPATISMMLRDGRLKRTTIDGSTGILLSEIWEQAAGMR